MHVVRDKPVADTEDRTYIRNDHAPYVARRFVHSQLLTWGVPELIDSVELVASELVTNAVEHSAGREIGLRLERVGLAVKVRVWDAASDAVPMGPDPAATYLDESGRGLLLTDAVSDQWGWYRVSTGGKCVWAIITSEGE